ncbi:DUF3024 domain-containing protein [Paenibacillus sp. DMB20]|nr:DUF3024 domain-containing protein [Paenibacillus sp. DMB20]
MHVAQFRLNENHWKLYWQDIKEKWHS